MKRPVTHVSSGAVRAAAAAVAASPMIPGGAAHSRAPGRKSKRSHAVVINAFHAANKFITNKGQTTNQNRGAGADPATMAELTRLQSALGGIHGS